MKKKIATLFILFIIVIACSSSDDGDGNGGDGNDSFDRSALLAHTADNIIIPAFQDFQSKLSELDIARGNFVNDMTESNLQSLSASWLNAYKVWQYVQMFNIGEAQNLGGGERGFVSFFNIYPLTVSDVENGAAAGNYDLNTSNYHDAQGFSALDFLIHGVASGDVNPIDKFMTNSNAEGYVTYITNVVAQMNALNNSITSNWENNYRDVFVNNTDTGLNGSVNKLINAFIFFYEKGFRAEKIGIPAGNFSTQPLPEKVEGFYKRDVSKTLALEALTAIEDMFNGRSYSNVSSGESFKTYLETLDRSDLVTAINLQFAEVRASLNSLNTNFYEQVETGNTQMTQSYDTIQAGVPLLKVDMAQTFNVVIDYVDADGD